MTLRFYISILPIVFCLTSVITSCRQTSNDKKEARVKIKSIRNHNIDTVTTAVISFAPSSYPFDNTNKSAELTEDDFNNIDSLLVECVDDYNNSLDKEHKGWAIDLNSHNYKKQVVAIMNKNGEKEIWVNCFCKTPDNSWKTNIRFVSDGGNCYFNLKINLGKKKFYAFSCKWYSLVKTTLSRLFFQSREGKPARCFSFHK
ncbi:MAG: hypothetical protein V4685_09515 [Bacteroidota bacterium]